jgi:PAS domain S-box-containing protein
MSDARPGTKLRINSRRLAQFDVVDQWAGKAPVVVVQLVFGLACTGATIFLRAALDLVAPTAGPFALVYPAILISTLFGRWQSGITTYATTFLWTWYGILPPKWSFDLANPDDQASLVVNLVTVLVTLAFAEIFRSAVRSAVGQRDDALMDLEDSEAQMRMALEAGRLGSWTLDVSTNELTTSEACRAVFGRGPQEPFSYQDLTTAIHPSDRGRMAAAVEHSIATHSPYDIEYRILTPGGELRWVQIRAEPIYSKGGALCLTGVSIDATERKRTEARRDALVQFTEKSRDSTDPADIEYAASEVLGEALAVSRVGFGTIDHEKETLRVERDWNLPGVQTLAGVLALRDYGSFIDSLKLGECISITDVRKDARTADSAEALEARSARAFANVPVIEQGKLVAVLYANNEHVREWSAGDIALMREVAERVHVASERARSERALRESEEQFRVFAQAIPNQLWAGRADGYLDWFSDQVYAYCGAKPGTLDGTTEWARIVHPEDLADAGEAWARSLETGEVYETEFRICRFDGVYRWFLVRAEPVRGDDGRIVRWVGTNTDIDDRRRQTAELALLNATLEDQVATRTRDLMITEEALRQSQKMEAVGQLTGGLAHDFNNLLTGIGGSFEMIENRLAQGRVDSVDRYVTTGQGAVKRAAALTHRLLAFSRRQTLDPKPTNVNRLVAEMEELIRRTVGPGVYLEVVGAGGLWPTLVDPNQLENSLLNLCINARDAMPDGGRLTIETANKWLDDRAAKERDLPSGQYVSLCVTDTGIGMSPDVIAKAFDPFFTTKPLGQGTGLGLSMIYGFARQSGG